MRNHGILMAYIAGTYMSYYLQPYVFGMLAIVYLVNFAFLPNTPQSLLRDGKIEVSLTDG